MSSRTNPSFPPTLDPASIAGKQPPIDATTDILIVGAGPAGLSAALTAAGRGAHVTLVDENPIGLRTMGEDVPLHFGGRMAPTVANRNAIFEQMVAARPDLLQALDAGVDVRLGSAVWGLFPPHPTARWLGGPVAGLADADNVYLMRFKQAIVATGRRDMGLAFAGWERPGVMGISAAYRLATTYAALDCKVAVLVGSGAEALQAANFLAESGVRIEAILERSGAITGPADLLASLTSRGTRVFTRHVIQEAFGDSSGVTSVRIAAVDATGWQMAERNEILRCDTVLLGVGAVPTIELVEACGCRVSFREERGGHVPVIDASQRTSEPNIHVAGDCAGVWPSKSLSESIAAKEGRIAAVGALRALGLTTSGASRSGEISLSAAEPPVQPDLPARSISASHIAWVRAAVAASPNIPVCQCEDVTAADILSLRPPRYLQGSDGSDCQRALSSLASGLEHPPNPDAVKRLTRAAMGTCQGRRCREQIAALIAMDSNTPLAQIPLATYRTPVRPLTLAQLAGLSESPLMSSHWDSWFGMPTQWTPYWRVQADYTVANRDASEPPGGE
jgi:thioredoxin reductase